MVWFVLTFCLLHVADSRPLIEVSSPITANSLAMTVPNSSVPMIQQEDHRNNVLSLFSPLNVSPRANSSVSTTSVTPAPMGLALTNGTPTLAPVAPPAAPLAPPASLGTDLITNGVAAASPQPMGLIDEDLPLLSDSEGYSFGDGEEVPYLALLDLLRSNGEAYSWDVARCGST